MLHSKDAKDSPRLLSGWASTGRQADGGINGAWDKYLLVMQQVFFR